MQLMQPVPKDFDWVRARSKCSLGLMFDTLAMALKQDVETASKLLEEVQHPNLVFHYTQDRRVVAVTRERFDKISSEARTTVRFVLSQAEITVESQDGTKFTILPSLNPVGECKMMVDGQELEVWQVCRKALEHLFFFPD